jgi:phosphoenolpyruvate-protein kinase (PTS system EI component)
VLPLLIGLGVRKLSVGAARLPDVAQWITSADTSVCAAMAGQALQAVSPEQVKAP